MELPTPVPRAQEVRVKVKAVALNHLDLWVRVGWPGLKLPLPHVLGSDVAGVIDAVGAEVSDLPVGTEVLVSPGLSCGACARCLSGDDVLCRRYQIIGEDLAGGYAEFVCVPRQNILMKPKRLSFEEAACLPLTFLTAWHMLFGRAQLKPGADHLINYAENDFLDAVKKLTSRRMVDVVFEHVGAITWEKSIACLSKGGRLVICGATSGHDVKIDLRTLFYKSISLLGSTMGSKSELFKVLELVEQGRLAPVLDRVLPLEKAAQAHGLLATRQTFGNVVLTP